MAVNFFSALYFIFGLVVGSFLNAAVYRIKKKKNLVSDRSICPHCKHRLAVFDLIPVVSYLLLAGKCRYCGKKIGIQYPAVELATAILYYFNYTEFLRFPDEAAKVWGMLGLVVLPLMIFIFVYDLKYRLILDKSIFPLYALGLVYLALSIFVLDRSIFNTVVPAVVTSAGLFAFFYLLFYFSSGRWMGGGDVKLMPAYGLFFGYLAVQAVFLSFIIGSIVSVFLMLFRGRNLKSAIPFGPFLVIGFILTFFFGDRIWSSFTLNLSRILGLY